MTPEDLQTTLHIVSQGILPNATGPGIVFVRLKADALVLAQALGLPAVTGDVPLEERAKVAEGMRAGSVRGVVATDAWSAGIDIPCLKWVAVEAWTKAPIGVQQRIGRGSRLAEGKPSFDVFVLPGRYEQEIKEMLLESGQAVLPAAPGSPAELADYLLLGKQPHGARQSFQRAETELAGHGWVMWTLLVLVVAGAILHFCQTGSF